MVKTCKSLTSLLCLTFHLIDLSQLNKVAIFTLEKNHLSESEVTSCIREISLDISLNSHQWAVSHAGPALKHFMYFLHCVVSFVFKVCVRACARALGAWRWRGVLHPLTWLACLSSPPQFGSLCCGCSCCSVFTHRIAAPPEPRTASSPRGINGAGASW